MTVKKSESSFIRPRASKKKEAPTTANDEISPVVGTRGKIPFAVVAHWWLLPVLLTTVVAVYLFQFTIVQPSLRRSELYTQSLLDTAVDRVQQEVNNLQYRLQLAASDPQIAVAFANKDQAALQTMEIAAMLNFPDAIGARLLPLDWHNVESESALPISHITLDVLRQLASKGHAPQELISGNLPHPHVLIVTAVKQAKQPVGALLLGVKTEVFQHLIQQTKGLHGYLELVQEFGGTASLIGSLGDKSLRSDEADKTVAVGESHWKIKYWLSASESPIPASLISQYWLVALILIGIIAAAGWWVIRVLETAQKKDAALLLKAILDARSNGARLSPEGYKLSVFQDIAVTLGRLDWAADNRPRAPERNIEIGSSSPRLAAPTIAEEIPPVVSPDIFRAYDIRGVVDDELTPDVVRLLGRAIGSEAFDRGEQKIAVARDGRTHGPELMEALKQGLMESGRDVIDLGAVPTPLLYFATNYLSTRSGVMLTGSHNPAQYNGLKIVLASETLFGDDIQRLRERIEKGNLLSGKGAQESVNIVDDYIGQITGDVALAQPLKIVIDCGNGIAGAIAPALYHALGCEVITLYCEVDGTFPNHHPDPSKPENLKELIAAVRDQDADIGLAFDGDGDRLGVVDSSGKIIWADRQLMLYAMDVLSRHPGTDIIFDVKCSRNLAKVISGHGGRPLMWKTGHSLIKSKMRETGALLAGECSGHMFFKERWYGFDDGLYAGARLLEILAADFRRSAEIFAGLPDSLSTPELNMPLADNRKHDFCIQLSKQAQFPGAEITTIDGLRVDFADGWGLVRASNTTPCLVIRFEADNESSLKRIQELFRDQMLALDKSLALPF